MIRLLMKPVIVFSIATMSASFLTAAAYSVSTEVKIRAGKGDRLVPAETAAPALRETVSRAEIPTAEIGNPPAVILFDHAGKVVYHSDPERQVTSISRNVVIGNVAVWDESVPARDDRPSSITLASGKEK